MVKNRISILFLCILLEASSADAQLFKEIGERCTQILKGATHFLFEKTEFQRGRKVFEKELQLIFDREGFKKSSPNVQSAYLEKNFSEWIALGDPHYHLSVLKYPIPVVALRALSSAKANQVNPELIGKILKAKKWSESQTEIIAWVKRVIENPNFNEGSLLTDLIDQYLKTKIIHRNSVNYYTGIPIIPDAKKGMIRAYKGSNFFKGPALSQSQVSKSNDSVLSGDQYFLTQLEANVHSVRAEAFHPDGVSVSLDRSVVLSYGSHVRIYDIPEDVVKQLPVGAPELREYVFRYSVPEKFRVMTLPKSTYLESIKYKDLNTNQFNQQIQRVSRSDQGSDLVGLLISGFDSFSIRGRTLTLASLYSDSAGVQEGFSIEKHTLMGYQQMKELGAHFQWNSIESPPNVDLHRTINFIYSLHDIGKSLAAELRVSHQELSSEILELVMSKCGFTQAEIALGTALVGNDELGKMLQGQRTPQEAFERLVLISSKTNLTPADFFRAQVFFYTVDASSYPELRASIFKRQNGMLIPKSEKFTVLKNLFENVSL